MGSYLILKSLKVSNSNPFWPEFAVLMLSPACNHPPLPLRSKLKYISDYSDISNEF